MQILLDRVYKLDVQVLKTIRQTHNTSKTVYFDFDGIFSGEMLYNATEKTLKSAQFSARYAIEMLKHYGFDVHIITGDASGVGLDITNAILDRIPVNSILSVSGADKYDRLLTLHPSKNSVIYVGEDLFDLDMSAHVVHMTPNNAHPLVQLSADYIIKSASQNYAVMDAAIAIVQMFDINPFDYVNRRRLTIDALLKQPIVDDIVNIVHNKTDNYTQFINTIATYYTTLTAESISAAMSELSHTNVITQQDHMCVDDYDLAMSQLAIATSEQGEQFTLHVIDNSTFVNASYELTRTLITSLATFIQDNRTKLHKIHTAHLAYADRSRINDVIVELLKSSDSIDAALGTIAANVFVDTFEIE